MIFFSTNPRKPKMDRTNAMPVHQVLYSGMPDIPRYVLQHGSFEVVRVDVDFRSMAGGSTVTQRPKRCVRDSNEGRVCPEPFLVDSEACWCREKKR